ncbi:MAG: hypothetical protein Q9224_000236 [Gallowayella concinna]
MLLQMLVLAVELPHLILLVLQHARIVTFAHLSADRAGVVEGGMHEGVVIIGGGRISAGVGAGADEIETFSPGFTRVIGSRIAFFDLETAFEARPAHGRQDMSGAATSKIGKGERKGEQGHV